MISVTPSNFSAAPASAAINHLLAQEPWARLQLRLHAGKVACIDAGAVALRLRVTADGLVEAAPADAPARVTIRVKLSDLPLIAQNRERAFSYVQIEGDAEFANAISSLSQSLRWEAEHDLDKVVGPIAAVRLVSGAKAAFAAAKNGHQKLAENVAEFLLDEKQLLVRPQSVTEFSADVVRLRDDVERAAKRLAKLEQKLGSK
jgi:ubiquinone biosynthesis protein UbiJ